MLAFAWVVTKFAAAPRSPNNAMQAVAKAVMLVNSPKAVWTQSIPMPEMPPQSRIRS